MTHDAEQRIRERAYHLWEQAGRPHGRDREFWHEAAAAEHGKNHAKPDGASAAEAPKPAKAAAKPDTAVHTAEAPKPAKAAPKPDAAGPAAEGPKPAKAAAKPAKAPEPAKPVAKPRAEAPAAKPKTRSKPG